MALIAHLTDLHLLETDHRSRGQAERMRLRYLSLGRSLDAQQRQARATAALARAREANADYVAITGDLTEDGAPGQFEVLAAILSESRIPADRIALIPGNHDIYSSDGAWAAALRGPLSAWRAGTESRPAVLAGEVQVLVLSTLISQPTWRSAGKLGHSALLRLAREAARAQRLGRALVVLQHHGPVPYWLPGATWVDGLLDGARMLDALQAFPAVWVLHGHEHRLRDRPLAPGMVPRIFGAPAVVDCDLPLRLYSCDAGGVVPITDDLPAEGLALQVA